MTGAGSSTTSAAASSAVSACAPAGAITVARATGTWKINPFACVQCAGCVEVCPKKCLHMDPEAPSPDVKKSEIILQVKKEDGVSKVQRKVKLPWMTGATL